jgi:hypothetical protein
VESNEIMWDRDDHVQRVIKLPGVERLARAEGWAGISTQRVLRVTLVSAPGLRETKKLGADMRANAKETHETIPVEKVSEFLRFGSFENSVRSITVARHSNRDPNAIIKPYMRQPTNFSSIQLLLGRRRRRRRRASSPNSLEPQARVEFTEVRFDLPALNTKAVVPAEARIEDVDTLHDGRTDRSCDRDEPSERDSTARNSINVDDRERDGWLSALAELESKLGWEGDGALGRMDQEVDAVGCVCEVGGEERISGCVAEG